MEDKRQQHEAKMKALKKHFTKLKLIAVLICLAFNIVVDAIVFAVASAEIIVFAVLITLILSVMLLINYLNRLDKIKIAQETQLMEETPLGKMKF